MTAGSLRGVLLILLPLALFAAPAALAGGLGHSALAPLPSVLPPTPLPGGMHWSRAGAPMSAAAFGAGLANVGVTGRVDGRALAAEKGLRVVEWLPGLRLVEVAGRPSALARLGRIGDPRIRYVEPVTIAQPAHVRNDPLTYEVDPRTGVPYEWQFHAVGTDQALNLGRGDPSILVGVLDTGITAVPDLAGKIAETFWDPAATASGGDALGHGTFVASIIASRNDDGRGLAGFCGACRLAVYKAPRLTNVQVAEGIRTLTDAHVRVINLSIVLDAPSEAVIDALNYATAAGVLVVAAAGNEGRSAIDFPASYLQPAGGGPGPGIAVGASDRAGARASFSNLGQQLSLLAPGTFDSGCRFGVFGAIPATPPAFETSRSCPVLVSQLDGARYAYESGTSYAAPEVSGTAALIWSLKPSLTSVQVATILEQTATRPAGTSWSSTSGWGVLDARAAAESVTGRSSDDAFVLRGLSVTRPRRPAHVVKATVEATWADGTTVTTGAAPACRIWSGARTIRSSARLAAGVVTCKFTPPGWSAGQQLQGSVTMSAPNASTATARFRIAVAG